MSGGPPGRATPKPPAGPRALAVFARPILPGQVKTRLARAIGPEAAARLYAAFLEDTWATASAVPGATVTLWVAGDPDHPSLRHLPAPRARQPEADLGRRMGQALDAGLAQAPVAAVVGSDAPTLPVWLLEAAFAALEGRGSPDVRGVPAAPPASAALGPAADGGYTLLGVRRPIPPGVLDGIAWSTETVLAETVARLAPSHGLPRLLAPWYDVDDVDDLRLLRAHLAQTDTNVAPATRRALADVVSRLA